MITQKELKRILTYNTRTGEFVWKVAKGRAVAGRNAGFITKDTGYHIIKINKRRYPAHRLAWLYVTGEFPVGEIDHINRDRKCNVWDNLRDVSRSDNQKNAKLRADNTSGVAGVSWSPVEGRWKAYISNRGHLIHLGTFLCITAAILKRKAAEMKYGYFPININPELSRIVD